MTCQWSASPRLAMAKATPRVAGSASPRLADRSKGVTDMKTSRILIALVLSLAVASCGGPEIVDAVLVCGTSGEATFEGTLNRNTAEFIVPGDVRVILKTTPGNPVVAVRLFLDGGARNLSPETAGIETFTLDVATEGGTTSMTRAELSAALDAMGSGIGSAASLDFSTVQMNTLKGFFEDTWSLFRDVLEAPSFPEAEIERLRQQHVQALLMRQDNPDDRVVDAARELLFTGHPYANLPRGTAETIGGFSRDQLVAYYEALFRADRMLLVIVGDMTQLEVAAIIGDTTFCILPPKYRIESFSRSSITASIAVSTVGSRRMTPASQLPWLSSEKFAEPT